MKKQSLITNSYYFLSESLIIFLALTPIFHVYFAQVPYFTYIFIILSFAVVLAVLSFWTVNYFYYVFVIPLMAGAFYLINFPWLLSLGLAFYFIWRYLNIRAMIDIERDQLYLRWALILAVFSIIFVNDYFLIGYLFILFLILISGNLSRHLIVLQGERKRLLQPVIWLYLLFGLIATIAGTYFLFPALRWIITYVWQGIIFIIVFSVSKIIQLLVWLNIFDYDFSQEDVIEQPLVDSEGYFIEDLEGTDFSIIELILKIFLFVVVMIVLIHLVQRLYRFFRQRFKLEKNSTMSVKVLQESLDEKNQKRQSFMQRMLGRFTNRPKEPVRKLVYDLERQLAQTKYARKSFETIEEWFERIGIEENLKIYQQVRYGNKLTSIKENDQFKVQLQKVQKLLFTEKSHAEDTK